MRSDQEYSAVKDRIPQYEKRRDQILLLNFTVYAFVVGLAGDTTDSILPIFLSLFLLFSVILYRYYLILQHFSTAYLIVYFEGGEDFGFETSYSQVFFGEAENAIPLWVYSFIEPYNWMIALNLSLSYGFLFENIIFSSALEELVFHSVVVGSCLAAYASIFIQRNRTIKYFVDRLSMTKDCC
jgi:hypothetical protein